MNTKTNFSYLTRTATLVRAAGARATLMLLLLLVTTATAWAEADLIIRSEADWNTFAANVANATNDYNGKLVVLAADISVSTMAGADNYNFFRGTFDGCGHTLTINLTGGYAGTAPFRRIENATIKNLNVAGTITTNTGMAGSIAFVTNGITHITNCLSTVSITGHGSGTDGGLVSCNNNELYFTNCAFKGKLLGEDEVGFGGFVGWNNVKVVYNHCLFAPSQVTMSTNGSSTFTRGASGSTSNYNNSCYYTQSFGIVQGTYTNATGSDLQALLGDGWEVSGNDVVPKMVNSLEVTDVPYRAYNTVTKTFETLTAASCEIVTKATTTMGAAGTESWYVVSNNATVSSSRIEVLGTVHLILVDGYSMRAEKGIHVPSGGTLNIYDQSGGTGQLHAFSNTECAAGIGGNDRETNGTITIHGGSIETWGDFRSPGIGSGYSANGGTTIIYGGSITATGGYYASGIGGGNGVDNNAGIITIVGGSVTAQGGEYGAGIGGGVQASGGTITISGGMVIAKAKYETGGIEDNSQAIGNGAGATHNCTLFIGDMKVYSSAEATNPVAPANRESICQSKYAKLIPCTNHNYVNGECTYCGGVPNVPVTYLAYQTETHTFVEQSVDGPLTVNQHITTMGAGDTETWYAVRSNVTNSNRIEVRGTVHLILCDGKTLTASKGITVNSGNSLTIYGQTAGTGTLNATGSQMSGGGTESAPIGSTNETTMGSITIHGGLITANSIGWTAGIGGGIRAGGGSITIYGGIINATGSYGNSEAIGHGADGAYVSRDLADGLRVTTNNNSTPVAYSNRVSGLSQKIAKVEPCTEHYTTTEHCDYCGLTCYRVFYDSNNATSGTAPAPNTAYRPGATVTVLGNTGILERTGYIFTGWNTKADGSGTTYTAGATFTINGNTTLYAKWTPITYTVRFHKNHDDAIGTMSDQTFTYDVSQTLTANSFTCNDYDFVGWNTATDGTVAFIDGQSVSNLATEQGTVVNLYAMWGTLFTITYNLDGGTVATPNPTTYSELSSDITLVNPTRDGYTFTGWTGTDLTKPTKTVTIANGSTGNREYTAKWTLLTEDTDEAEGTAARWYVNMPKTGTKTLTLSDAVTTFKVYDNGGKNNSYSNYCDGTLVLTAPMGYMLQLSGSITTDEYDLLTVYDGSDNSANKLLNEVYSTPNNTQTAIKTVTSSGQNMTLYFYSDDLINYAGLDLTVTLVPNTITYNSNNATSGTVPVHNTVYTPGETAIVLGNTGNLERTGYTFAGWNTADNGSGTTYVEGSTFTIYRPVTLYAVWAVSQLTLANNDDNGDAINTAAGNGMYYDVTLADRTLYRDGDWNTLCLPFDVTISGSVLDDATAKTLRSTDYDSETGTLTLNFGEAVSTIEAGKPYIIKWERNTVDLSTLTANYTAQNGDMLTGKLGGNYKISIAAGATVTLNGVTINGTNSDSYKWAGITCVGNATIVLKGTNTVKGFYRCYSGIYVPSGKTLTIKGDGSLTASTNGYSAGIGSGHLKGSECGNIVIAGGNITATGGYGGAGIGGSYVKCGNITITGGNITATGGGNAAGIGGGYGNNGSCGNITITGGNITATGGNNAAGIGSGGSQSSCGNITITDGVTSVTATKGKNAPNSIGKGDSGSCGTITIGDEVGAIATSPYTYEGTGSGSGSASGDFVNPVFTTVTISNTTANVSTDYVDFVGTYSPVVIYESGAKHNLYLGSGNNIYYPSSSGYEVKACRGYFVLKNGLTAGDPNAGVRAFVLNFGEDSETGETTSLNDKVQMINDKEADAWYDLSGRKLSGVGTGPVPARLPKGVYINNGRKVVIK